MPFANHSPTSAFFRSLFSRATNTAVSRWALLLLGSFRPGGFVPHPVQRREIGRADIFARMVKPAYTYRSAGLLCTQTHTPRFLTQNRLPPDFDVLLMGRAARMFACTNQAYDHRQEPGLGKVETNDPGKGKKARWRPAYPLSPRALGLGPQHHRLP